LDRKQIATTVPRRNDKPDNGKTANFQHLFGLQAFMLPKGNTPSLCDVAKTQPLVRTELVTDRLNSMNAASQQKLIELIHGSEWPFVISVTGGGSGAISALLQVPGASATVLEAIVPYSARALEDWLGGAVEQYCSEKTARAMAMRAFERAQELTDAAPQIICGIGATASLATNRPKRGAHRIHIAWQSAGASAVTTCRFTDSTTTRAEEEEIATQLILYAVAESRGLQTAVSWDAVTPIEIDCRQQQAPKAWTDLLLGHRKSVLLPEQNTISSPKILFPGAFNPLHRGHMQMADVASRRCGGPVTFELSIVNVDKPPLDFIEISERLAQFTGKPVFLTRAPTFVEKAALAPGCVLVVGADTLERIADPRYYDNDSAKRDTAISQIADSGCRFLVFGRDCEGRFQTTSSIDIPPALRKLCDEVPESEFRIDISSTELRTDTMSGLPS
jgi:nicotinamide mononucleotide (NMN) deamidase PncC